MGKILLWQSNSQAKCAAGCIMTTIQWFEASVEDPMASVKDIYGISEAQAEALAEAGVRTTSQLLEAGATSTGRMRLADEARLTDELVKKWVHQADLMRIDGVGAAVAGLLCAVGVCTVPKLAYHDSDSLRRDLLAYAEQNTGATKVPSISTLEAYIAQAKKLRKIVHH